MSERDINLERHLIAECYRAGFEQGFDSAKVFAADGLLAEVHPAQADLSADIDYWLQQFGHPPSYNWRPGQLEALKRMRKDDE